MIKTDALIIGAGPTGLFTAHQLKLIGLNCEVVDNLDKIGGQCIELYPDKPIYDIPAMPECTGEELTENLLKQIEPFDYGITLNDELSVLNKQKDGTFMLETNSGKKFQSKAVVIAGGVGSFQPRQLRLSNADEFTNKSLHYKVKDSSKFKGKKLVVLGGGDSALDWAIDLSASARELTLIHRRGEYRAVSSSVKKARQLCSEGKMNIIENTKVTEMTGENGQLTSVKISQQDAEEQEILADHLLVFYGLSPKLGPIADWGLDINRKTINVDTEKFQTSEAGIYAVGDINFYPGKKKLILSGFHEAALTAFAIKQQIEPNKKVHLQYTTTSSIMHKRLGVKE